LSLPFKYEALNSNPSIATERGKEKSHSLANKSRRKFSMEKILLSVAYSPHYACHIPQMGGKIIPGILYIPNLTTHPLH
jgi:hypothetical protein